MNGIKIFAFADEASGQIDGQIAAMRRNSLNGLEIRGVDGQNIADISLEKALEVRRKMDDAGLSVWSMGSPIGKVSIETPDFPSHLDKLRHVLELANVLGAKNLRMFSFYVPEGAADLGLRVIGSASERVTATVYDPTGKEIAKLADVSSLGTWSVAEDANGKPIPPMKGFWSVKFEKPSQGVLEDYIVTVLGVPALLR